MKFFILSITLAVSLLHAAPDNGELIFAILVDNGIIEKGGVATILVEDGKGVYVLINDSKKLLRFAPDLAAKPREARPYLLLERTWNLATDAKRDPDGSTYVLTLTEAQELVYRIIAEGAFFKSSNLDSRHLGS